MKTPLRPPDPTPEHGSQELRLMTSASTPAARGELLTTRQAAVALGVHERTLRRYLSAGLLDYRRLPGGHYRVPAGALAAFWQANDQTRGGEYPARRVDLDATSEASGRRQRQRAVASRKPSRLGSEAPRSYDLSLGTLRAVRARVS